jgi:integrase
MKFTDKGVASLKPEAKQYYQRESEGFTVRVLPSGVKTWLYIYTISGKRRQMNLGEYPDVSLADARERAADARKVLNRENIDPQEYGFDWHRNPERERRELAEKIEEDLKNPSVTDLAKEYMEKHARENKRESSAKEDQRLLNKDVLPVWGERKAKDIRKRDVILLLENAAKRGPALTHNIFKLVRKMYNFAVSRDILESTPCAGVKIDEIAAISSRDRVLKEPKDNGGIDEIVTFWNELEKAAMTTEVKNILKLILVTGQRPGEVAGIHSREIDGHWWTIPVERRKVKKKSKNPPQPHRVYLSNLALQLIGEIDGYAFPSPANKFDDEGNVIRFTHIDDNAVAYAVRRNLKDYQPRRKIKGETIKMVKVAEDRKMAIDHFTPHDLRRTCSTRLAELGYKDEVNDAILGHVKAGVVGIYNRYKYDKEKQRAMEAWERKLKNILSGVTTGKVIPLKRKVNTD